MKFNDRQRQLIKKYLSRDVTDSERREIRRLMADPDSRQVFDEIMDELQPDLPPAEAIDQDHPEDKLQQFKARYNIPADRHDTRPRMLRMWVPYTAAAAVLLLVSVGISVLIRHSGGAQREPAQQTAEVVPGSNKALLTLADGSTILLAEAANGELAQQQGVRVEKTADGEIVYHTGKQPASRANLINTIATPNGGQYRITLPDGSRAWLNAASSLSYPTRFAGNERRVKMTGEVYFEVAKATRPHSKEAMPFIVETDRQSIQVLGTQFNVNAYTDEPHVRTALVEGSVRVTSSFSGKSVVLKPGQESVLSEQLLVRQADIPQRLAWKNGEFIFKGEYLGNMLRQIARWYDIRIECPEQFGKIKFSGIISRTMPLATVADMIESTGEVNVEIEGRRLRVSD